ncbi:MAG: roadblock/LC7 domain-containing protein [Deltaproteobacteria bacterium]|nr:roadblock/LC7 domain-containing protein [Deltaproteobacteria bacterium]
MKTVLKQLNAVPGVVGSLVCSADGQLVANAFPPLFDEAVLGDAARVLVDGAAGLESVTGKVKTVDLRFAEARVVLRPMAGAHLVLLCSAQTNLQLVSISAGVAVPKLEKLAAQMPPPAPPKKEKAKPEKPAKPARAAASPGDDPGFFHW